MNAKKILISRIDALLADLDRAKLQISQQAIPAFLHERAGNELLNTIDDQVNKLNGDRADVDKLPDASNGTSNQDAWKSFDLHQASSEKVLKECLAFREGVRMRAAASVEAELCEVADALLDELSNRLPDLQWKRFSYVSGSESFTDYTQMIRLRFPLADIWSLPAAAHEYGHFLSFRLNPPDAAGVHRKVFDDYLVNETRGPSDQKWVALYEFFADIFATWALGPAFAFTCVLLRFNPVGAWISKDSVHPPEGQRAMAIVEALSQLGGLEGSASKVSQFWKSALAAAGEEVELPEKETEKIRKMTGEICKMLAQGAPNVKYESWNRAAELEKLLQSIPVNPPALRLADLLNAAWRLRLTPGTDPSAISKNFVKLWQSYHTAASRAARR